MSDAKFYHFPWSSAIGQFDPDLGIIVGSEHIVTLAEIELNIDKHDFAVVTLQPQEFSVIENGAYTNAIDPKQIRELELLLAKIQALGYKIVPISEISQDSSELSMPNLIKNNAEKWANSLIIEDIQFLVNEEIMVIQFTDQNSGSGVSIEIPNWVKYNAEWWSDGLITDTEFVSGIQWLITSGIMKISS